MSDAIEQAKEALRALDAHLNAAPMGVGFLWEIESRKLQKQARAALAALDREGGARKAGGDGTEPIEAKWEGDLADDCTLRWKDYFAHVEQMASGWWWFAVSRGDDEVYNHANMRISGRRLRTGREARNAAEAVIEAIEQLRATNCEMRKSCWHIGYAEAVKAVPHGEVPSFDLIWNRARRANELARGGK